MNYSFRAINRFGLAVVILLFSLTSLVPAVAMYKLESQTAEEKYSLQILLLVYHLERDFDNARDYFQLIRENRDIQQSSRKIAEITDHSIEEALELSNLAERWDDEIIIFYARDFSTEAKRFRLAALNYVAELEYDPAGDSAGTMENVAQKIKIKTDEMVEVLSQEVFQRVQAIQDNRIDVIQISKNFGLLVLALGLSLSVLVAILLNRSFVAPIFRLIDGIQKFGKGDTNYHFPEGKGEIGKVCESLNMMLDTIKRNQEKLKEKQLQLAHAGRLTSMGEMATGIAHEINQPLTIIDLAVQCLARQENVRQNDATVEMIEKIEEQINRITTTISNMRSFTRIDAQTLPLIDLRESINLAVSFFGEQFRLHEIQLDVSFDDGLQKIRLNPQKFEQVVVNLLSNARYSVDKKAELSGVDYTKKIGIRVKKITEGREGVLFEIEDNGIGMSQAVRDRCLEPFFTLKDVDEGTGLGLSIVNNIVHEIDGRIEIDSKEGEGAVFRIFIKG